VRLIGLVDRERDNLASLRIELLAVAELVPQPRADTEVVTRVEVDDGQLRIGEQDRIIEYRHAHAVFSERLRKAQESAS
jgi:hypothetical protein